MKIVVPSQTGVKLAVTPPLPYVTGSVGATGATGPAGPAGSGGSANVGDLIITGNSIYTQNGAELEISANAGINSSGYTVLSFDVNTGIGIDSSGTYLFFPTNGGFAFYPNGHMSFPDNTVQNTAYLGYAGAAGNTGELQFNSNGTLSGLPSTWDGTNLVFQGANEQSTDGGSISILGGTNGISGNGGNVIIQSGIGDNYYGSVFISAAGFTPQNLGDVFILSGNTLTLYTTQYMAVNIQGSAGAPGQVLTSDGANTTWQTPNRTTEVRQATFTAGSSALTTNVNDIPIVIGANCTITKVVILGLSMNGNAVVDIFKSGYSGFPSSTSICASAKPTLSAAQKAEDSTLTGWTTSLSAGDILLVHLDSVATFTTVVVALYLET